MRLLELFKGTGSIGKAFENWEIITLDIDPKSDADITADILTWDYSVYSPGYFDVVWEAPLAQSIQRRKPEVFAIYT